MATRLSKVTTDSRSTSMVPPHNLEAEESVLGACLLSRQAIATALETLSPDDFYKPAHSEMFAIMLDLYAKGEPLDAVTMGEELRRAGKLEEFGGKPYLFTLVSAVPTPGSVGHYARIVQENATLRRLIDASQQIRDLAFALPDDVEQAVDQSEDLIYQVTNRRSTEDIAHLKDLLTENMELVEKLYERGSAITGVATGFTDLDELTAGLQASNLIIVAARPSMGKALALDTPIATPAGWTPMGELAADDTVFDELGNPCRIVAVSEVYRDHDCYEVEFDDGAVLIADAGHQWTTTCPRQCQPRVVTTQQMASEGLTVTIAGLEQRRWYVRSAEALDLPEADLELDPYVLGCRLTMGDTGVVGTAGDTWAAGTAGAAGLAEEDRAAIVTQLEMAGAPAAALGERVVTVPVDYLRASFKQRLALLQGVMDAAGMVIGDAGVTVELRLESRELLEQVQHLVCSLGHKPGSIRGWAELGAGNEQHGWLLRWNPPDPVFRVASKAGRLARLPEGVAGVTARRSIVALRSVPPVPVRCIQVDSPSHLYLAGEGLIPTHNSALALSIAQHVATNDHVPVVYFSLEMSKMELVQRLMCSEARVDSNRLRKGALQDADWPKLSLALGRLAEAPIFIDDTPNATIMEMRAKCRRIASKGGLGMVIIDYLQLMAPLKRTDNRVQEVSEISRSLKILARELEVPVIALSQLSRNVEYRADKRPLLADLRESGCVTADTRILRADTGAEVTIGELYQSGERNIPVWTMNEDLKLVRGVMTHAFSSGIKEVFRLRLASGRELTATASHPIYTFDGMKPLGHLAYGERVAVVRQLPQPEFPNEWPDSHLILLAHLIGGGSALKLQPLRYVTMSEENLDAVTEAAKAFGVTARRIFEPAARSYQLFLPAPTPGDRNPINSWLEGLGLFDKRSYETFVPEAIFGLSNRQVGLFLRHLWATDGHISLRQTRTGMAASIYYATSSPRLAQGVSLLLLRFGIVCRIKVSHKADHRPMYQLWLGEGAQGAAFTDQVGAFGPKIEGLRHVVDFQRRRQSKVHHDTVPVEVWSKVDALAKPTGYTRSALATKLGAQIHVTSSPSRTSIEKLGTLLDAPELAHLAESDVFWDRVVAKEPLGECPVFDATVLATHNFVANQTVISNSIEQDADVVMFIYRDEVYHPDSPQRGIAELHISKHRSGPIGKVELTFLEHYTKFANLARGM